MCVSQAMGLSLEVIFLVHSFVGAIIFIVMSIMAGAALRSTKSQVKTKGLQNSSIWLLWELCVFHMLRLTLSIFSAPFKALFPLFSQDNSCDDLHASWNARRPTGTRRRKSKLWENGWIVASVKWSASSTRHNWINDSQVLPFQCSWHFKLCHHQDHSVGNYAVLTVCTLCLHCCITGQRSG